MNFIASIIRILIKMNILKQNELIIRLEYNSNEEPSLSNLSNYLRSICEIYEDQFKLIKSKDENTNEYDFNNIKAQIREGCIEIIIKYINSPIISGLILTSGGAYLANFLSLKQNEEQDIIKILDGYDKSENKDIHELIINLRKSLKIIKIRKDEKAITEILKNLSKFENIYKIIAELEADVEIETKDKKELIPYEDITNTYFIRNRIKTYISKERNKNNRELENINIVIEAILQKSKHVIRCKIINDGYDKSFKDITYSEEFTKNENNLKLIHKSLSENTMLNVNLIIIKDERDKIINYKIIKINNY